MRQKRKSSYSHRSRYTEIIRQSLELNDNKKIIEREIVFLIFKWQQNTFEKGVSHFEFLRHFFVAGQIHHHHLTPQRSLIKFIIVVASADAKQPRTAATSNSPPLSSSLRTTPSHLPLGNRGRRQQKCFQRLEKLSSFSISYSPLQRMPKLALALTPTI